VRITQDVQDGSEYDPGAHSEQRVYKFYIATVSLYDADVWNSPKFITSEDGLNFNEMSGGFGPELEVLEKTPVPWQRGYQIRALLDMEQFKYSDLLPEEIAVLSREVTLEPGEHAGRWAVIEHRELLQEHAATHYADDELVEGGVAVDSDLESEGGVGMGLAFRSGIEVALGCVRQGRIIAAPIEYFSWLARRSWPRHGEPPVGYKGNVGEYAEASEMDKLMAHIRWECWFGPENEIGVGAQAAE